MQVKYAGMEYTLQQLFCLKEIMLLLEPLINEPVNYVRQAALIASAALVLIQHTEHTSSKVSLLLW